MDDQHDDMRIKSNGGPSEMSDVVLVLFSWPLARTELSSLSIPRRICLGGDISIFLRINGVRSDGQHKDLSPSMDTRLAIKDTTADRAAASRVLFSDLLFSAIRANVRSTIPIIEVTTVGDISRLNLVFFCFSIIQGNK